MKKQILYSSAFLLLLFISLSSCTMDKRLYRPGYSVQWNASKKNSKHVAAVAAAPTGNMQGGDAPTEVIVLAPETLPEDPALELPAGRVGKATAKQKEEGSVDALILQSNEEDRAIAEKAESQKECNRYAAQQRAKMENDMPQTSAFSKREQDRADFNNGFRRGFQFVHLADELMDEPRLMPLALAALICGIVSIVAYYGAFVLGVLAIVFGAVLGTLVEALGVIVASHIYLAIGRRVRG